MECDGSLRLDNIARRDVMGRFSLAAAPCVSPSLLRACTRQSNQMPYILTVHRQSCQQQQYFPIFKATPQRGSQAKHTSMRNLGSTLVSNLSHHLSLPTMIFSFLEGSVP